MSRGDAGDARSRAYYDDFSDWYERERGVGYHRLIDDLELGVVEPLAQERRVLEVGCGTGLILGRLGRVAKQAWGVDPSSGMIRGARERGLNVVLATATALPFPDDSFDLVCSFKVLPHVPDVTGALREAARVTRPGGQLVLEFYNPYSVRYLVKRLAGPQPISDSRTEADVFTRWDAPGAVRAMLPPSLQLEDYRGVRVFTPAAFVHRLPGVGRALSALEQAAVDSPLRYFGGFLIAMLRKRATV